MATLQEKSRIPKKAFFEISYCDRKGVVSKIGRAEFDLYKNTPITSANFGQHCTNPTSYAGTAFHRVIPKFMCQFGDIENARVNPETGQSVRTGRPAGTGGYGLTVEGKKVDQFADENFENKHEIGALSMANAGPGTNGSQIFICTSPCDFLDGKHVVFGKIADADSMAVIKKVESYGSQEGETTGTPFVSAAGVTEYWDSSEFVIKIPTNAYLDISLNGEPIGRIETELYTNTPKTSQNFADLCNGFSYGNKTYGYTNTFMHRVIPGFMCQMGDVTEAKYDPATLKPVPGPNRRPGTGGVSAHCVKTNKAKFADENFINKHEVGALSMANSGPNTNGSQIFICTAPCTHLNRKHVVFGKVANEKSMEVVKKVEQCGSPDGTTSKMVCITGSGVTKYADGYSCPTAAVIYQPTA